MDSSGTQRYQEKAEVIQTRTLAKARLCACIMDKNTKEILVRARKLISTPEKWTQGTYARDKANNSTPYSSRQAVCFCTSGAIHRAHIELGEDLSDAPFAVLSLYSPITKRNGIAYWNDMTDRRHSEVLALFDRAIAGE